MSQQSVREIFAIQALCSRQLKACVIHLLPVPVHGLFSVFITTQNNIKQVLSTSISFYILINQIQPFTV